MATLVSSHDVFLWPGLSFCLPREIDIAFNRKIRPPLCVVPPPPYFSANSATFISPSDLSDTIIFVVFFFSVRQICVIYPRLHKFYGLFQKLKRVNFRQMIHSLQKQIYVHVLPSYLPASLDISKLFSCFNFQRLFLVFVFQKYLLFFPSFKIKIIKFYCSRYFFGKRHFKFPNISVFHMTKK